MIANRDNNSTKKNYSSKWKNEKDSKTKRNVNNSSKTKKSRGKCTYNSKNSEVKRAPSSRKRAAMSRRRGSAMSAGTSSSQAARTSLPKSGHSMHRSLHRNLRRPGRGRLKFRVNNSTHHLPCSSLWALVHQVPLRATSSRLWAAYLLTIEGRRCLARTTQIGNSLLSNQIASSTLIQCPT
jgi:hypothetical protein